MLHAWAIALRNPKLRALLAVMGVIATIAFGPMSVLGAYLLVMALLSDAPDRYHFIGWSIAGAAGVVGIVGAWVRLLVPGHWFEASASLRWGTAVALFVGVAIAALTFAGAVVNPANLMPWLMVLPLAVGVFLLGATLAVHAASRAPLNKALERK